jgi:TonB-dependent SusC/RagA subfamily outer membrane receptor
MNYRVFFFILLAAICINGVDAQKNNKKITITGTVLDVEKGPMSNAIIMIDEKNTDVITDADGNYKIKVKPDAATIGVFTFGSGTFEDSIKGRTVINFNFGVAGKKQFTTTDAITVGEAGVNTGYSHVKKKNTTTEITSIDGTDKKYDSYSSIYEMIQREVSGVQVKGHNIIVQGAQDMFGSVPPLFVVDGTYVDDISSVSPSSVKSIEVLKGTSAAIYGSRGYGGVIVIKTKIKND